MSANLSAMLGQVSTIASFKSTALGLRRLDKQASKQSDQAHNALSGVAKTSVSRLAGAEHRVKEITDLQEEARQVLKGYTTAWGDRRLLPNAMLETFVKAWSDVKTVFDDKVDHLKDCAADLIEQAERNKGTFNVKVPTIEEIQKAFSLEFALEPVPDVSQFSSNLDKSIEAQMKQVFEDNIKAAYTEAQRDAVQRIAKPLQNLVERMTVYEQREDDKAKGLSVGKTGTFNDTIISNVQEIAEVFGSWNLTGDPILKKLDDALSAFGGIEADDLRKHKDLRADVSKRANAILDQIKAGGYL